MHTNITNISVFELFNKFYLTRLISIYIMHSMGKRVEICYLCLIIILLYVILWKKLLVIK